MKKFFYYTLVFFFLISALLLILSYSSVYISPGSIPLLAFLGLFFPFIFVINLLFLIFWAIRRKKWFFLSLILIIAGFYRIHDFYAFSHKEVVSAEVNPLKVMSYNVRLFDLYNWSKDENTGNNILRIIQKENPDIICIQEFYSDEKLNYTKQIIDIQKTKDYLISNKKQTGYSGVAIFSRYPIISRGYVDVHTANQKCIFADIVKDRDTIRVYSIHLASVHLSNDDYQILKNFDLKEEEDIDHVTGIGQKFMHAYEMRSLEVETIAPHIRKSPYRTIVCGDFNDTPVSYSYRQIKGDMKDAFIEQGSGIGNTYNYGLPLFRIDYILHSPLIQTKSFTCSDQFWSDHHAVTALMEL